MRRSAAQWTTTDGRVAARSKERRSVAIYMAVRARRKGRYRPSGLNSERNVSTAVSSRRSSLMSASDERENARPLTLGGGR